MRDNRARKRLFALALLICVEARAHNPTEPKQQYIEVSKNTLLLFCYGADNSQGSRFARSDILVAPNGQYRAYAESEALLTVRDGKPLDPYHAGCVNTSQLLFSATNKNSFQVVLSLTPTADEGTGNGLRPVDWSSDSRFLLVEWNRWFYESEYGSHRIMIFDTKTKTLLRPEVEEVEKLFQQHFLKECYVFMGIVGFSQDNRVVLAVFPDDYAPEDSCVQDQTLWLLDPWKNTLEQLPDDYKAPRYGKVEEHKVEK